MDAQQGFVESVSSKKGSKYFDDTDYEDSNELKKRFAQIGVQTYTKQDMDEITEQLTDVAAQTGYFGEEFEERTAELKEQFFDFEVSVDAENWYNASLKRVQLGKVMRVTIYVETKLIGLGVFSIPVTASSSRSALSRHYWKG